MGRVNDEINSIVDNYNATYESYVISDVENASKDDFYDAYNAGKSYIWYAQDGKCAWGIEYDTVCYICDRYGNVLYTN